MAHSQAGEPNQMPQQPPADATQQPHVTRLPSDTATLQLADAEHKPSVAATKPHAEHPPQIGIFCVGNILLLDEGLGPRVAAELTKRYTFPPNVEILDRGTMGMTLLAEIKRLDVILLVDAVDNTGEPPGTVVTFSPEDIAPYEAWHGAHDTRFVDVLQAAALLGYTTDAHCLGVQVQNMHPPTHTIALTEPVEASIDFVVECVLGFLSRYDVEATPRA